MTRPSRRDFLRAAAIAGAGAAFPRQLQDAAKRRIPARFIGDGLERGHHWLEPDPAKLRVDRHDKKKVVIVGGGIAGCVAAWRLQSAGVEDFVLLELEDKPGGLARSGRIGNLTVPFGGVTMFGLGPRTSPAVLRLLKAAGVDRAEERFSPWVFEPRFGPEDPWRPSELGQGHLSPPPPAMSSAPSDFSSDRMSVSAFLNRMKADADRIAAAERWCLMRYGARSAEISGAFANFGEAIARTLVFPEGFASLLKPILDKVGPRFVTAQVAVLVEPSKDGALVRVVNALDAKVTDFDAGAVILAVPPFVAAKIAPRLRERDQGLAIPSNTPWLITAFQVDRWPKGFDPGMAFHQCLDERSTLILHAGAPPEAVIVSHRPFPGAGTMPGRMFLRDLDPDAARDWSLRELEPVFPDLRDVTTRVEIHRVGHGSIRPGPGYMTEVAPKLRAPLPPIYPCGADYAGAPSVESAITEGVRGGEEVLKALGKLNESWL